MVSDRKLVAVFRESETWFANYTLLSYIIDMEFIELPSFSEAVDELLSKEEFQEFQNELILFPEKGDLIQGTGGARKVRVRYGASGKSGGARAIYHFIDSKQRIWLLAIYAKSKQEDLTVDQKKLIKQIIAEIKKYEKGS